MRFILFTTFLLLAGMLTGQRQHGDDIVLPALVSGDSRYYPISMSDDGQLLAVGNCPTNHTLAAGEVYLYRYEAGKWVQKFHFVGEAEDQYAYSVALSGDGQVLAVGAPFADQPGQNPYNAGMVYIYRYDKSTDTWREETKLLSKNSRGWGNMGHSLSLSERGDHLAVGVPRDSDVSASGAWHASRGAVYFYKYNATSKSWDDGELVTIGGESFDQVGSEVVLSEVGDYVAVHHELVDDRGSVEILKRDATTGTWERQGSLLEGEAYGDFFGAALDIARDGKTVAIGAQNYKPAGSSFNDGHVRVFEWNNSTNNWMQVGTDIHSTAPGGEAGTDVALVRNGKRVIVGTPNGNSGAGKVSTYDVTNGGWVEESISTISGEPGSYNYLGRSVDISENGRFIGVAYAKDHLVKVFEETVAEPATALNFGYDSSIKGKNVDLPQGDAAVTVECWVNMAGGDNWANIFKQGDLVFYIYIGRIHFGDNYSFFRTSSNNSIIRNTWHHIAATYENGTATIYIDGVKDNTVTLSRPLQGRRDTYIIGDRSNKYIGSMDELRVWNYARTEEQIANNKDCLLRGNEAGLVAYFPFDQGYIKKDNGDIDKVIDKTGIASEKDGTMYRFKKKGETSNWVAGHVSPRECGETACAAGVSMKVTYTGGGGTHNDVFIRDGTMGNAHLGAVTKGRANVKNFTITNTSTTETLVINDIVSTESDRSQMLERDGFFGLDYATKAKMTQSVPPGGVFSFKIESFHGGGTNRGTLSSLISIKSNDCAGDFVFKATVEE